MPQLILLSYLLFAFWLIRRDIASRPDVSSAVWIPTLWLAVIASRPLTMWLGFGGSGDTLEGSPLDRAFYLLMEVMALVVILRRGLNLGDLVARNWPLALFYGFLFISVIWANSPFSSFKRWTKEVGNILLVLVMLTEANPMSAIRAVFVRCAYVLIPVSIILIRYFPDIGRRYNIHSGEMESIGVTNQKNSLGTMILACGLIFLWDWLERSRAEHGKRSLLDRVFPVILGFIAVWLLFLCDSKTSILSLIAGCLILLSIRMPLLRQRLSSYGTYSLVAVTVFFVVDREIGITEVIVKSLGRDMTFTGRTDVWRELLGVGTDRIFGTGYMSFWDDAKFQAKLPYWVGASAHNGYLEIFLAGGYFGVGALVLMLLGTMARINRALAGGSDFSAVRFAILVMMLIANFAESNFACMTPLGFLFLIAAIGHVQPVQTAYLLPDPRPEMPTKAEVLR